MKKMVNGFVMLLLMIFVLGCSHCFAASVGASLNGQRSVITMPLENDTDKFRYTANNGTTSKGNISAYMYRGQLIDQVNKQIFCKSLSPTQTYTTDRAETYNFVCSKLTAPETGYVATTLISQQK